MSRTNICEHELGYREKNHVLSRTSSHKTIHTNHEILWFYDVISQKKCWIFRESMGFKSSRFAKEYRTSRCGQRLKFERWNRTVALAKSREPKWSFVGQGSTRIKTGRHVFYECYMMMYTMFIFVHISNIYIYVYLVFLDHIIFSLWSFIDYSGWRCKSAEWCSVLTYRWLQEIVGVFRLILAIYKTLQNSYLEEVCWLYIL